MRILRLAPLFLCASIAAFSQQPVIPGTAAGRTLQAWLNAWNSGDRAKITDYVKTLDPAQNVDEVVRSRDRVGALRLLSIESSAPLQIHFRVQESNSGATVIGDLLVKNGNPPTVIFLGLSTLPPGATPVNVVLDAALRTRVMDGIKADLTKDYVFPALAARMNEALDAHERAGDYNSITDGYVFAQRLTEDLRAVSHDKHLHVHFVPFTQPSAREATPQDETRRQQAFLKMNCQFDKVEVLPGNIGYVKFDGFADPAICGATVTAAMSFVAHTDALIFDLRDNKGGYPGMVSLIASYLFDQPTHLNDLYNRPKDFTTQYWTLPWVPGTRMPVQPVFVLTSHRTISGAEEFTYDLKTQKRATIVGETTAGGAHIVQDHPLPGHFVVGVPFGTAINPITKTGWEGTGVTPDVSVPASDALATAEKLALANLQAKRNAEPAATPAKPKP